VFLQRFEQRLASMSANQDLLVRRGWATIPMGELADAQLAILDGESRNHVSTDGPHIDLAPRGRSYRHGAARTGHQCDQVRRAFPVRRKRQPGVARSGRRFVVEWRERGGPAVAAPRESGFGTTLIRHIPARSLSANVTLDYAQEGLLWRLDCDADVARNLAST
jgi:two-component sensor histidine kinase